MVSSHLTGLMQSPWVDLNPAWTQVNVQPMHTARMRDCSECFPSVAPSWMLFTMAADKHMCGSKLEPEKFLDALRGAEKLSGFSRGEI